MTAPLSPPPKAGPGRLVLELRAGERMLVNGAELQFRGRTTVILGNRARFLFGRQVLDSHEGTSPARRLYLLLQTAYAGDDAERAPAARAARDMAEAQMADRGPEGRAVLRLLLAELSAERGREALLLARRLFAEDDISVAAPSGQLAGAEVAAE